jgi:hypothetical protein
MSSKQLRRRVLGLAAAAAAVLAVEVSAGLADRGDDGQSQ